MKKTFLLLMLLFMSICMSAASFGILVNGKHYFGGTLNPAPGDPSFTEYMCLGVPLKSGDALQLYDEDNKKAWVVTLDAASTTKITLNGNKYACKNDGCYDFYIKLKYGNDQLYIGDAAAGCTDWGKDIEGGGGSDCQDGPYGVIVSRKDSVATFPAVATGEPDTEGRVQYMAQVKLMMGDTCRLINLSCDARWMVDLDPYGAYTEFQGGKEKGYIIANTTGCYDFYIKLKADDDILYIGYGEGCKDPKPVEPCPEERPTYATSAPAECPDVMLQGFYWDSYHVDKTYAPHTAVYGDTKWTTLLAQAGEIGAYFDMVWLPPSAKASGVGYAPAQYSNQSSDWGSRVSLIKLIDALHAQDAKVIADIVVNHGANKSTWCNFYENDFRCYGTFSPTAAWICNTDEMNYDDKAKDCKGSATGAKDDGYGDEANYASSRDWDHANPAVRNMFKAYLKFMKNYMGYDGWRYDYCKGFHNSHIDEYNKAAGNYFSVMEYWDGNKDVLQSHLNDANWNTCTFDFATKYEALNRGIAAGNYSGCKGPGLLGAGKSRYAVTFVDSHDSFGRDDNEFLGKDNSMKNNSNKDKVLQANAFILAMPGVPCVFYPHWHDSYTGPAIRKMVDARHIVGVHSESAVSDEGDGSGYKATVTGKNGSLVLLLGNKSGQTISGYTKYASGNGYAIWVKYTTAPKPNVIITPGTQRFTDAINGVKVTLSSTFTGLNPEIYYTLDGTTPSKSSTKYTGAFTVKTTTTVKAIAYIGSTASSVQEATFTYKEAKTPITVRMAKTDEWKDVYLFAWATDAQGTNILGGWPGTALTLGTDGWYSYTFDNSVKEINFIFNNGGKGEQTADLFTTYDVCYLWEGGCEVEDEDCSTTPSQFQVILSPGSKVFRDATKGLDVTMTVLGAKDGQSTIYYTTDGTTPNLTSPKSTDNPTIINVKQTTTVKALAVSGGEQTQMVSETYTYKAPQTWPITVTFRNTANWNKVNLYSWGTNAAQTQYTGAWPGKALTANAVGEYTYTFDAAVKDVNIIFNNGSVQSSNLYTDEDNCWLWGTNIETGDKDAVLCSEVGLEEIRVAPKNNNKKFMVDGHIYLQCDGHWYNALGIQMK